MKLNSLSAIVPVAMKLNSAIVPLPSKALGVFLIRFPFPLGKGIIGQLTTVAL
jgi:hypothetical protein